MLKRVTADPSYRRRANLRPEMGVSRDWPNVGGRLTPGDTL